jgi:hypothetical protein
LEENFMNTRHLLSGLAISVLSIGAASPALALANRVFVSARSGNNANACDNVNTPCQTFAGAVIQLNPNGEVIVLDSGGYGPVTITQGVTIEAPAGVTAFIHPPSGDAITINAGSAKVTLRGLTLNVGTNNGITVTSVGTLSVEDCSISGFSVDGISILSGGINVVVKGTDIKGCGDGVRVRNTSGTAIVTIDRCHLDTNSGFGFSSINDGGSARITITNSTASRNDQAGIHVGFGFDRIDKAVIESCVVASNGFHGILANASGAGSEVAVSNCTVTGNPGTGLFQVLGVLSSRLNNTVRFNGTDTSGVVTFSGN